MITHCTLEDLVRGLDVLRSANQYLRHTRKSVLYQMGADEAAAYFDARALLLKRAQLLADAGVEAIVQSKRPVN